MRERACLHASEQASVCARACGCVRTPKSGACFSLCRTCTLSCNSLACFGQACSLKFVTRLPCETDSMFLADDPGALALEYHVQWAHIDWKCVGRGQRVRFSERCWWSFAKQLLLAGSPKLAGVSRVTSMMSPMMHHRKRMLHVVLTLFTRDN